jgi:hypothetical protein
MPTPQSAKTAFHSNISKEKLACFYYKISNSCNSNLDTNETLQGTPTWCET